MSKQTSIHCCSSVLCTETNTCGYDWCYVNNDIHELTDCRQTKMIVRLCDHEFDQVIQISNPDTEGYFKNGSLYTANYDIPVIYFSDPKIDLYSSKIAFFCLSSTLLEDESFILPVKRAIPKLYDVNEKIIDRIWITKFLLCGVTVSFSWYENAELLTELQSGDISLPYPSAFWFEELPVEQ